MKKRQSKNRIVHPRAATVGVLLVVLAGLVTFYMFTKNHQSTTGTTPAVTKGNSVADEPKSPSPSVATPTSQSAAVDNTPPAKPSLQKSSGNAPGSSVPAGVVVEFSCEGTPGLQCDVVLTDRTNASHVIDLGKKTIAGNDRGSYFALWDWPSVHGSWNVVAKAYSTGGTSTASDTQTLEVK